MAWPLRLPPLERQNLTVNSPAGHIRQPASNRAHGGAFALSLRPRAARVARDGVCCYAGHGLRQFAQKKTPGFRAAGRIESVAPHWHCILSRAGSRSTTDTLAIFNMVVSSIRTRGGRNAAVQNESASPPSRGSCLAGLAGAHDVRSEDSPADWWLSSSRSRTTARTPCC